MTFSFLRLGVATPPYNSHAEKSPLVGCSHLRYTYGGCLVHQQPKDSSYFDYRWSA